MALGKKIFFERIFLILILKLSIFDHWIDILIFNWIRVNRSFLFNFFWKTKGGSGRLRRSKSIGLRKLPKDSCKSACIIEHSPFLSKKLRRKNEWPSGNTAASIAANWFRHPLEAVFFPFFNPEKNSLDALTKHTMNLFWSNHAQFLQNFFWYSRSFKSPRSRDSLSNAIRHKRDRLPESAQCDSNTISCAGAVSFFLSFFHTCQKVFSSSKVVFLSISHTF